MIRSSVLAAALLMIFAASASAASIEQLSGTAGCFESSGKLGCAKGLGTEWVSAAVVSPDGKNLYAASGVGSFGAILSFSRDSETGALTQLSGQKGCISSTGLSGQNSDEGDCAQAPGLPQANDVAISPDGLTVYTLAQAGFDDGQAVDVWRRDPATGELTLLECWTANSDQPGCEQAPLDLPTKFVLSPDGKRLVAGGSAITSFPVNADGTLGAGTCQYKLEAEPGNLCDPAPRLKGLRAITHMAGSPDGSKIYVTGGEQVAKGQVAILKVNESTGDISLGRCVGDPAKSDLKCGKARAIASPGDIAVAPNGGVYVAAWFFRVINEENGRGRTRTSAISVFTGALKKIAGKAGCVLFAGDRNLGCAKRPSGSPLDGANAVAVSPNGKLVVAGFWESSAVALLKRDGKTQKLKPVTGTGGCVSDRAESKKKPVTGCALGHGIAQPTDVAFSPDGRSAYVPTLDGMSVYRVR